MNLTIRFGALAPPIKEQLPPGTRIDPQVLEDFQRDAWAIDRLVRRKLLNEGAAYGAREELRALVAAAARESAHA